MSQAIPQHQAKSEGALPTASAALYLLLAMPLSLFLYLKTSPEAASFLAGYSSSLLNHSLWPVVLVAFLAAALMVLQLPIPGRKWLAIAGLVIAAAAMLPIFREKPGWEQVVAFGLCLPGWLGLAVWVPAAWPRAGKPMGSACTWALDFLLLATAAVIAFAGNALCMLLALPELRASQTQEILLLGRVAAVAGVAALFPLPLYLGLRAFASGPRGGWAVLLLTGALLETAAMTIFLDALRFIGGISVRPASVFYIVALTMPAVALFCYRVATLDSNFASGFLHFGHHLLPSWCFEKRRRPLLALMWMALLFTIVFLASRAHLIYEWGFATASFYSALSVACVWCLLTALPARTQAAVNLLGLGAITLGCLTFAPALTPGSAWKTYLKFDKNFGSVVHAYYNLYPSAEPVLAWSRRLLEAGHDLVPTNLTSVRLEKLIVRNPVRRPNVFFIVADALREETYGGSPAQRRRFPGADWMASRFTVYDNAWTSYNSTIGSYPAYLNGEIEPGWYHYFGSYPNPIHHDNVLVRACYAAGYRCYNFATFSEDFASLWPKNTCVQLEEKGHGVGDPGEVFPQALDVLDNHRRQQPDQPAFFYLHLYNMHQPLCDRPGIPLEHKGAYFMRALYEQNAAYFDQQLLAFLKGLERRGELENSTIVVTADHGEELFEMGGVYHGWQINPWVMHVPLFVHYPAGSTPAPQPGANPRPVNLIDLAPTLCQTMGLDIVRDSEWQGVSLLQPEPSTPRSFLLLSWKNRLVGKLTFRPARMLVLDLNSGQEEMFLPGERGWELHPGPIPPAVLAQTLNQDLAQLLGYWKIPVGTLPIPTPPPPSPSFSSSLPRVSANSSGPSAP